jgi:CheY-like chemotaxis protein
MQRSGAMPNSNLDHPGAAMRDREAQGATGFNLSLVLVAATSKVNRIVVSRIVERAGFKAIAEPPEQAAPLLETLRPVIVIVDGGADNREGDAVLDRLAGLRRANGCELPRVILLTTTNGTPEKLAPGRLVDAVVAKPITPERLQPLVGRMIEDARDPR